MVLLLQTLVDAFKVVYAALHCGSFTVKLLSTSQQESVHSLDYPSSIGPVISGYSVEAKQSTCYI